MVKKRLLLTMLLLALILVLSGCGRVEFSYVYTKSGEYRQQIDVYIDEDLSGTGYTLDSATEKLNEIFLGEGFMLEETDDVRHLQAYKDYATFDELQSTVLGNGLYDYTVTGREDFLFDYSVINGEIAFDRNSKQGYLLLLLEYGVYNFSVFGFEGMQSVDDVEVSYSMRSAQQMKTNADEVTEEGGYYRYVWYPERSGDYSVQAELREPRKTVWYALAVFASALTVAGFLIYARCNIHGDDADIPFKGAENGR